VVLDDAVVNDANLEAITHRKMRVGVRLGWRAVCRPARMGKPGRRLYRLSVDQFLKVGHAASGAQPLEVSILDMRTGRS
jgi:hypothetical protein